MLKEFSFMLKIVFYDTFNTIVYNKGYRKFTPSLTKSVMAAPENYGNTWNILKDLFYVSVGSLVCGLNYAGEIEDN